MGRNRHFAIFHTVSDSTKRVEIPDIGHTCGRVPPNGLDVFTCVVVVEDRMEIQNYDNNSWILNILIYIFDVNNGESRSDGRWSFASKNRSIHKRYI